MAAMESQPICRLCGGRVAWTSGMVLCLSAGQRGGQCDVPLCKSCGTELVPDDRVAKSSSWRRQCGCPELQDEYDASDQDLALMGSLLLERGLAPELASDFLTWLAGCRTKVVFQQEDGTEVVVTFDEVRTAIGHDLAIP